VVVVVVVVVAVVVVEDIVLLLTHNLSHTEEEKTLKCENLALEIKNILKFNTVFMSPQSSQYAPKLPKMSTECRFNGNILKSETTSSTVTNVSFGTQIGRMFRLILGDRMNLLPPTEPDHTDSLGWVKGLQQIDGERCD
jgi:hypothetical protein